MNIELIRVEFSKTVTIGVLKLEGKAFCVTLEPPIDQAVGGAIPEGEYECVLHTSPKHGEVVKVLHVPNRSDILFHVGNYPEDTTGCILLGASFVSYREMVGRSAKTVSIFLNQARASKSKLTLNVRNFYNERPHFL